MAGAIAQLFPAVKHTPQVASGPDQKLRQQSRLLSRLFLTLFSIALLELIIGTGAMLFRCGSVAGMQQGSFIFLLPVPPLHEGPDSTFIPASTMPVWESMLATLLLGARLLPGVLVLWHLRILFLLYAQGSVFARANARQVRLIAFAALGYAAVPFFTHGVLYLVHLANSPVRMQIRQVDALVLGLVLLTIARVMTFGHEIESDREGFV